MQECLSNVRDACTSGTSGLFETCADLGSTIRSTAADLTRFHSETCADSAAPGVPPLAIAALAKIGEEMTNPALRTAPGGLPNCAAGLIKRAVELMADVEVWLERQAASERAALAVAEATSAALASDIRRSWLSGPSGVLLLAWGGHGALPKAPAVARGRSLGVYVIGGTAAFAMPAADFQSRLRASLRGADAAGAVADAMTFGGFVRQAKLVSAIDGKVAAAETAVVSLADLEHFLCVCAAPLEMRVWEVRADAAALAVADAAVRVNGATAPPPTSASGSALLRRLADEGSLETAAAAAAVDALVPAALAVTASALAAFSRGGVPGAWAGFMPRATAEAMLLRQAASEGGTGAFLVRLSSSKAGEVVLSYVARGRGASGGAGATAAAVDGGGDRVQHEILKLSAAADGYTLRGHDFATISHALCAAPSRSFLRSPCTEAVLALQGLTPPTAMHHARDATRCAAPWRGLLAPAADLFAAADAGDAKVALLLDALCGPDAVRPPQQLLEAYTRCLGSASEALRQPQPPPRALEPPPAAAATTRPGSGGPASLCKFACDGYHGALSYDDARARLAGLPAGSYLLRSSRTQRGSTVLAFVDAAGNPQQALISPSTAVEGGITLSGYEFKSISHALLAYSLAPEPAAAGTPGAVQAHLIRSVPPAASSIWPAATTGDSDRPEPEAAVAAFRGASRAAMYVA